MLDSRYPTPAAIFYLAIIMRRGNQLERYDEGRLQLIAAT